MELHACAWSMALNERTPPLASTATSRRRSTGRAVATAVRPSGQQVPGLTMVALSAMPSQSPTSRATPAAADHTNGATVDDPQPAAKLRMRDAHRLK
jgi:hypothetical protein